MPADDFTLCLSVQLKAPLPSLNIAKFVEAFAQQMGVASERLTVVSKERDDRGCIIGMELRDGSPPNAVVSQHAREIMLRSHTQHRSIAGYAVVSVACQVGVPPAVDIESLMHRIRSRTKRDRIRIREFFEQHDRLRCRKCTKNKMRTSMTQAGYKLTADELSTLEAEFGNPDHPDQFDYDLFCSAVDCVFTETGLESHPLHEPRDFVPNPRVWDTHPGAMTSPKMDQSEGSILYKVCMRIAQECHRKRIALESYFKEYDKRRWGIIEARDFRGTLNMLGLKMSAEEMTAIMHQFAVPGPEVSYVQFVDYCGSLCDMQAPQPMTTTQVY